MTPDTLVFDASPLSHFARAGELKTLQSLVKGFTCVTTKAVLGELREGARQYQEINDALNAEWITTVSCDELETLYLFGQYMSRLGNPTRNAGGRPCSPGLSTTVRWRTSTTR